MVQNPQFKFRRVPYYSRAIYSIFAEIPLRDLPATCVNMLRYIIGKENCLTVPLHRSGSVYSLLKPLDLLILYEVAILREYERAVSIGRRDRIIVDIGAGFGDFAIEAAKKYPRAKIFAVEPDPEYFTLLQKNIKSNQVNNVVAIDQFVHSLQVVFQLVGKRREIDYMKIDCEGCEFEIFAKAERERLGRIKKISMEYHLSEKRDTRELEKLVWSLRKAGFSVTREKRKAVKEVGLIGAIRR